MAVNNDYNFFPEVPECAEFIVFATDLVHCVMVRNAPSFNVESYPIPFRDQATKFFDPTFERAVQIIDNGLKTINVEDFRQFSENGPISPDTYDRFVAVMVSKYFVEGFDVKLLLTYCVRISGMAALFFNNGIVVAPLLAKSYIFNILNKHHLTVGGWNNFHRIASEYGSMPLENIDSEEM